MRRADPFVAVAALAIAACSRADTTRPTTILVLASAPSASPSEVRVVAENGDDPVVGAWGAYATFEEVARTADTDADAGAELSFEELLGPLADDALVIPCGPVPQSRVHVRVAVLRGRAVGVTVEVEPDDPELARCIDRRIRSLAWEPSDRVQFVFKAF